MDGYCEIHTIFVSSTANSIHTRLLYCQLTLSIVVVFSRDAQRKRIYGDVLVLLILLLFLLVGDYSSADLPAYIRQQRSPYNTNKITSCQSTYVTIGVLLPRPEMPEITSAVDMASPPLLSAFSYRSKNSRQ